MRYNGGSNDPLAEPDPMSLTRAYEEIVDFIAAGASAREVANFRPSRATKERVAELVRREKDTGLTAEERAELEQYLQLEHLMRLAKARARQHLAATDAASQT
jgi:uncharacterized protein YnzC (UPF0291/DUF896 family)